MSQIGVAALHMFNGLTLLVATILDSGAIVLKVWTVFSTLKLQLCFQFEFFIAFTISLYFVAIEVNSAGLLA